MTPSLKQLLPGLLLAGLSSHVLSHGLMSDPPSRNAHCGMNEPADQATTPACVEAAAFDALGLYSYMSVLTHDIGRQGLVSENVCGFDAEPWEGNATPWDLPLDWPTTAISSGNLKITWDIAMGPHFDDTEEFVYYITNPDFEYQIGQALSWSNFETEPFCILNYDDSDPTGNPDVVADKAAALFHTTCNVPARSGQHVIYGEWGRNYFTYERFHGCIDVVFSGSNNGGGINDDNSDRDESDSGHSNDDNSGSDEIGAGASGIYQLLLIMFATLAARIDVRRQTVP